MPLRYLALVAALGEAAQAVSNSTITQGTSGDVGDSAPTRGLDMAYASSCNRARQEWVSSRGQAFIGNTSVITTTSSLSSDIYPSAWIETEGPTSVYTLCDGWPRMNATTEYRTSLVNTTTTIWSTFTTNAPVYRNISAPACSFGPRECSALESSYEASSTQWSRWYVDGVGTSQPYPTSPVCYSTTTFVPESEMTAPFPYPLCIVTAATIQLLYWPVSTIGNRLCGGNWTTVEATPTIEGQPNTAIALNTTFTSPTVYMVMSGAYEVDSGGGASRKLQGILPMSSDEVRSKCALGYGEWGSPQTMDYADFDPPFQVSKYRCQPACWTNPVFWQSLSISTYVRQDSASENLCSTIYDGVYRPALELPVTDINSYFAHLPNGIGVESCSLSVGPGGIFYDPPSALQQVQSAPGPSAPNPPGHTTTAKENPQSTPASPGPTLTAALPETTGGGAAVPQPTRPNVPEASSGDDDDDEPTAAPIQEPDGDPTSTQNIGDMIASIMGLQHDDPPATAIADAAAPMETAPPAPAQQNPADPAPTTVVPASDPGQDGLQPAPSDDASEVSPEQPPSSSEAPRPDESIDGDQSDAPDQPSSQPENPSNPESIADGNADHSSSQDPPGEGSVSQDVHSHDIVYAADGQTLTAHAPAVTASAEASNVLVVAPGLTLTEGNEAVTVRQTVEQGTTVPARTYSLAAQSNGGDERGEQGGQLVINGVTASRVWNGASTGSQMASTPVYSSTSNVTMSAGTTSSANGTASASAPVAEQTGNGATALRVPLACWALPLLAFIPV